MAKDRVLEDLSDRAGYDIDLDDLPLAMRSEVDRLIKTYRKILSKKHAVLMEEKERRKLSSLLWKKEADSILREELHKMELQYTNMVEDLASQIREVFQRRFEAKEGVRRNININAADMIKELRENTMKKCPNCGAPLVIDYENDIAKCEYCGSNYALLENKMIKKIL